MSELDEEIDVDIEDIDLVIEPRTITDEDREAFRCAIQQHRQRPANARTIEEAARILAQRTN